MSKREVTECTTEYMHKYNEDFSTTLIFVSTRSPMIDRVTQVGLFSAVSSAFVIDVQSKLESDPTERSEAYLRAILLSLNRFISPDEDPAAPRSGMAPPLRSSQPQIFCTRVF